MDARELRINNLVRQSGIYRLVAISTPHCMGINKNGAAVELDSQLMTGIEISPELLEKCGFKKDKLKEHFYHPSLPIQMLLRYNNTFAGTQLRSRVIKEVDKHPYQLILSENCRFLHQLQNLFHSLTGQELNVHI